jgi:hypothetical protein
MKSNLKVAVVLVIGTLAIGGLIFAYTQTSKQKKAEAEREQPIAPKTRLELGPEGEPIVKINVQAQQQIGLASQRLAPTRLQPEIKGYGRVLEPAPLAAQVADLLSTQAALAASLKEFERLKLLQEQKNASDRALQAAEASSRRDQIAVQAVRARLVSAWGKAVAERQDLSSLVESLVALDSALIRIAVPADEPLKETPAAALIFSIADRTNGIRAELLTPAPAVDPQIQGEAFLFLVLTNHGRLVPGMAVTGYLQTPGGPREGFTIPDSAIIRHAGKVWIYVQLGEDAFSRRPIVLDARTAHGWFVTAGITATDRVVISGAQALLSEEQKYQIRMLD